jgi:hypothetical protein
LRLFLLTEILIEQIQPLFQVPVFQYNVGDSIEVRPGEGNSILISAWPHPEHWSTTGYLRLFMRIYVDPVTFPIYQNVGEYCCGGPGVYICEEGSGTASPCGDRISLMVSIDAGWTRGIVPLELRK